MNFHNNCYFTCQSSVPESAINFIAQIALDYFNGSITCRHGNLSFVVDFLSNNPFFTIVNLNGNRLLDEIDPLSKVSTQIRVLNLNNCRLLAAEKFYSTTKSLSNLIELRIGDADRTKVDFKNLLTNLNLDVNVRV